MNKQKNRPESLCPHAGIVEKWRDDKNITYKWDHIISVKSRATNGTQILHRHTNTQANTLYSKRLTLFIQRQTIIYQKWLSMTLLPCSPTNNLLTFPWPQPICYIQPNRTGPVGSSTFCLAVVGVAAAVAASAVAPASQCLYCRWPGFLFQIVCVSYGDVRGQCGTIWIATVSVHTRTSFIMSLSLSLSVVSVCFCVWCACVLVCWSEFEEAHMSLCAYVMFTISNRLLTGR